MKRNEGFSFVGWMVIIAIMSIGAAMVVSVLIRYKESQEIKAQEQAFMSALEQGPVAVTDILFSHSSDNDKECIYYAFKSQTSNDWVTLPVEQFDMSESIEASLLEIIGKDKNGEARPKLMFCYENLREIIIPSLRKFGIDGLVIANPSRIFKDK